MPARSKIRQLPPELRREIEKLVDAGKSYDEITAHIRSLGADVSRSSIARFGKEYEDSIKAIRESREMASAMAKELGVAPDDLTPLLVEQLQTLLHKLGRAKLADGKPFTTKDFLLLSATIKNTADAAGKHQLNRERARKEFAEEQRQKLAKAADKGELSKKHFEQAMQILGLHHG